MEGQRGVTFLKAQGKMRTEPALFGELPLILAPLTTANYPLVNYSKELCQKHKRGNATEKVGVLHNRC